MNQWAVMAKMHWERYLPKMYRKYQEQGILELELTKAGQQAEEKIGELIEGGLYINEAKEIVIPQYILLTPEPDRPQEDSQL